MEIQIGGAAGESSPGSQVVGEGTSPRNRNSVCSLPSHDSLLQFWTCSWEALDSSRQALMCHLVPTATPSRRQGSKELRSLKVRAPHPPREVKGGHGAGSFEAGSRLPSVFRGLG